MRSQQSLFPALAFTTQGSLCLLFVIENFSVIGLSRHFCEYSTEYIKDKIMRLVCYCNHYSFKFYTSCAKMSPIAPGFVEHNLAAPK